MTIKRRPPNYRRPDCCLNCRAFDDGCIFYDFSSRDPDSELCDDFRLEDKGEGT